MRRSLIHWHVSGLFFRNADPAGEICDFHNGAEKDTTQHGQKADHADIPAISAGHTGTNAGKLAAEDGPDKAWWIRRKTGTVALSITLTVTWAVGGISGRWNSIDDSSAGGTEASSRRQDGTTVVAVGGHKAISIG